MVEVPPTTHPGDGALLRGSLAQLDDGTGSIARTFYATLFAIDPSTRDLFPASMTTQRERLVAALGRVVGLLDDPDRLAPLLAALGREHRTFGVVAAHYDSVGVALLTALRSQAGDGWDAELERAWTTACRSVAGVMSGAAELEHGPSSWAATVVEHRRAGDDLAVVRLLADAPVPHAAGQHVRVQVPQRPRMWRWLSPASAPDGTGELELHVRAVAGGWVSGSIVSQTRVGDRWLVGPGRGQLAVDLACDRDVLMIAGGTGLAPLRAIVQQLATRGDNPRVQLFVGGRTPADLYDLDALARTAATNPWLTVVPVVEQPSGRDPRPDGMHATLHGTLAEVVTRHGSWADRQVLLSGSPGMVRATLAAMVRAGTPLEQISWDPLPPA